MIDSAVVAQLFPVVRQISAKRGPVRSLCCMAMEHFPMHFASTVNGSPIDLVCKIKLFDETHAAHILVSRDGQDFLFAGCLNAGFHAYTILEGTLKQQFPIPVVVSTPKTKVLEHHVPSCDSLKSVVDLCAGFGGLAQGSIAAGFDVRVAVDHNQKMLDLYSKAGQAHTIHGDIGDREVMYEIWKTSSGASTFTSGFSCQPFSRLGDERSHADTRANCLTKTLKTAYYLNAQCIVLECVAPAAQDSFVKGEIAHFVKHTGFHCTQTELKLDHVWPCRRHRAWWVLSAPEIGPVELQTWPHFPNVQEVMHVIPEIRLWAAEDEKQLALDEVELQAFGVTEDRHAKYLLNGKAKAPCALHAWGSQTRACPCGCRRCGFSQARLESKGLHGCLTRSAIFPDGTTNIRHLHPNEAMGLNTFDPIIDFGSDVRLTLSAVGQLACPAQALWIMGSIMEKIDSLRHEVTHNPSAQVQAYRSWILMRCRQVWPTQKEPIDDPKLVALISYWGDHRGLSLPELLFPMRWAGQIDGTVSIAAVLDCLIKQRETIPPTIPDCESKDDAEVIPVFDSPGIVDDPSTAGCMSVDSCTVYFEDTNEFPVRVYPKCGSTLSQFLTAQCKLVGPFDIESAKIDNKEITLDHVMEVGQVIVIRIQQPSKMISPVAVSPTLMWTQPAQDLPDIRSPPRKVSKFDVGECAIPSAVLPTDQAWLDASPLQGLKGEQFLKLSLPCIQNAQQLWSLRHQFVRTADRISIMDCQEQFWADDEIRFHVHAVIQSCQAMQIKNGMPVTQVCVIDPLVSTAWIQDRGFDCQLWADDHTEVREKGVAIFTVVLIDKHWIPVYMSPLHGVLHVHTWDGMNASHEGLDDMVQKLAIALGFTNALIWREHRLFFTSTLCGALAIAFLRYALIGALLPTDCTEATAIHGKLKDAYAQELKRCQIARRPWVWGAGDRSSSSQSIPQPNRDLQLAVNVTRDQRIDLINEKGMAVEDDEIRFHITQLVSHQPDANKPIQEQSFIFMEPLIFNCWDSIGHVIAKQWCSKNPQVLTNGQNIVTAVALEDHWLPLWMVPSGPVLQVHTFHSEVNFDQGDRVLHTVATTLGFQSHAVHRIPTRLPDHVMCGAHALALLAHVIMQMPLPDTLRELRDLHTNMRASFVAHLYAIEYTPKPVVWGFGAPGESGPLPRMPEGETQEEAASSTDRTQRLQMLTTHSYAMGDDEIHFHVNHLLECHGTGPRDAGPVRHFITVSPTTINSWLQGDSAPLRQWLDQEWFPIQPDQHLIVVVLLQHWVPIWFAPAGHAIHCHTLADFAYDDSELESVATRLAHELGYSDVVVHKVPHGIDVTRLCGTMSISFLAHILLRTRLPEDVHQLRSRCWDMKSIFAEALETSEPMMPSMWGWGTPGECRPLPRMPAAVPIATALDDLIAGDICTHSLFQQFAGVTSEVFPMDAPIGMHQFEMEFHMLTMTHHVREGVKFQTAVGFEKLIDCVLQFPHEGLDTLGIAVLIDEHWQPVILLRTALGILFMIEQSQLAESIGTALHGFDVFIVPAGGQNICGVDTWQLFAWMCGFPTGILDFRSMRCMLHHCFTTRGPAVPDIRLAQWGFGPQGLLAKKLVSELLKHGVPETAADERAANAIRILGSEQVSAALQHRNSWKQLKMLGNNSKFQFVMPSELASVVESNKGKPVVPKGKGKGTRAIPQPVELDPTKLIVLEGTFHSQGTQLAQLTMQQIGPVSSGVILMSQQDAEPYLRSGKAVSKEPLALLVLHRNGSEVHTALPHNSVMVPCRCTVNQEPVLAEVTLVQVGTGLVEKATGNAMVSVDTPDVVTLKVMVYKDELKGDWGEFVGSPIRCIVSLLPKLRCFTADCNCPAWHNSEKLPLRDPILDVWRRQFLRQGLKPCPADQAEIYSVCIRIPRCTLEALLAASGTAGAYCEPRTADGKDILPDFTVIWTPKHSLQEMQHLMQTNPAVTGLARLGERRGLRVHVAQAKSIHQLVRPDTVFLPNGPKCSFTVGPFPYGVDRQAVGKILQQAGWECRPVQPTAPCPGRGAMWLVQSTEEPEHAIIATTTGEIVITKQKADPIAVHKGPTTVGSAATIALCGADAPKVSETDPWATHDPWRSYQPSVPAVTSPTEGMMQIEERIQTAVLAKIQAPMEQDDLPDRVHALEGQVHQLLSKQQGLEHQIQEYSGHHTQQIQALQGQVTAQAQQLHGHLENQNQTMQSLFEQQMQQIRGLLAKRPREEGLE